MIRQCVLGLLAAAWLYAADTPQALMDGGHHKRVRAIAEPLYREHPNDPEAQWMMSFVKLTWGDTKTALDLAEKAVAADPKNARYHLQLAQALGAEAQKASIIRQPGLAIRFRKELETTLTLDPKNLGAMRYRIMYDFEAPGIMGGDKAHGRAMAEQATRVDPADGYALQAMVARYDKQQNRVEELLHKAVDAGPNNYDAQLNLAYFYVTPAKKYAEAEGLARAAMRIDPGRTSAHSVLAMALIGQDKWADLEAALAQSEKDVPDDLTPYFQAGLSCLARPTEAARAERYFRKYLTQEPEPHSAGISWTHWRLGQAMEKQGHKAEAIAEWQTAVKLDAESPAKQDLKRVK